jgi:hypothetical protein
LNRAVSQCDLSGPCSIFRDHLLKVNQAFPFQAHFAFFSDLSNRSYPLVRSFKAFLSSGVLFLVCLFVCFVCLCPMIVASRTNVVRELGRVWRWRFWATSPLWLKASVSLIFCPNNFNNHFALLCINFDGFLLRMTSLIWLLSWTWFLINIDGRCCLVCSTGLVIINVVTILCSMFLYDNFNTRSLCINRNMENHPGKQYNHKN